MIVLLVAQLIVWNAPKLTPTEAAAVLAQCSACASNVAHLPTPIGGNSAFVYVPPRPAVAPSRTPSGSGRAFINGVPMSLGEAQRWQLLDQIVGRKR